METKLIDFQEKAAARVPYSRVLRCVGQSLDGLDLKAFELKRQGNVYLLQGWHKGTSSSVDLELRYTLDDVKRLESEGRKKRRGLSARSNLFRLSEVLRLAGNYVDHMGGRLLRVSWQYQSDKIQSVTIQYEPREYSEDKGEGDHLVSTIDEVCVHVYRQRKRIAAISDSSTPRLSGG